MKWRIRLHVFLLQHLFGDVDESESMDISIIELFTGLKKYEPWIGAGLLNADR